MINVNLNSPAMGGSRMGTGGGAPATQTAIINYGNTTGTYVTGANYNHAFSNFTTGNIPITGENSGDALPSIRNTLGASTGWGVNHTGLFSGDSVGENAGGGPYPITAVTDCMSNPGGTRNTTLTGLNPAKTYTVKVLMSVDTVVEATSLADLTVSGASGGGTVTGFNERGNVSTYVNGAGGFSVVPTAGGVITLAFTVNTGHCAFSVIEITEN